MLARHGETQWNKQKKLQGQLDSPLTSAGIEQAKALARSLITANIELIVSSVLPRAQLTADIVQQQLSCPLREDNALIERHFGDWQGQLISELEHNTAVNNTFNEVFFDVTATTPPNGESALASAKRLQQALINIAENTQKNNILVVSHGDILRCFLSVYAALNFKDPSQHYLNGRVFSLDYSHQKNNFVMVETAPKSVALYD